MPRRRKGKIEKDLITVSRALTPTLSLYSADENSSRVVSPKSTAQYTRSGQAQQRRKSSLAHIKAKFSRHYPSAVNSQPSSLRSTPRHSGDGHRRNRRSIFNGSMKSNLNERSIIVDFDFLKADIKVLILN